MTREELKSLGIEDDAVINGVMALNGKAIEKSKSEVDTLTSELTATRAELESHKQDLIKLGDSANASEETKAELDRIKAEFETKEADFQKKLDLSKRDQIVDRYLLEQGTIDLVASKAHLGNAIYEAELKDGEIVGLVDLVSAQKENKAYLYNKSVATGLGHTQTVIKNEPSKEQQMQEKMFGSK